MRHLALVTLGLVGLSLTACDADPEGDASPRLSVTDVEAQLILDLVNDPATDTALLDDDVGLDARAAQEIIELRNGLDDAYPSGDDGVFHSLEELDAVAYVGPSALGKLRDWALAHPPAPGELVEGVMFSGAEIEAIVWGLAGATEDELDDVVGLSSNAAHNLATSGPYATLAEVGAVPYVGPATLETLRDYAPIWITLLAIENAGDLSGTFDGVSFDHDTALVALAIANGASATEMTEGGIWATGAARIEASRPYADLQQLAGTSGIGTATLEDLHAMASAGWPSNGGTCAAAIAPVFNASVNGYSDNMVDFDTWAEEPRYHLRAFAVPECLDVTDPSSRELLRDAMIGFAGWGSIEAQFPEALHDRSMVVGTARFDWLLDGSIQRMSDIRDDHLAQGNQAAEHMYDGLAQLYGEIDALASTHGDSVSLGIHFDNEECSEEVGMVVDTTAGLAIAIHRRAGC